MHTLEKRKTQNSVETSEQTKPKGSIMEEIIIIRTETNGMEDRKTMEKINETMCSFKDQLN